ncbi:MAG: ribonuclease III [Bacteroidota bacterium]
MANFLALFKGKQKAELRKLSIQIKRVTGFKPKNVELYKLSLIHSSAAEVDSKGFKISNERLEYLGDAVLDLIIAEYLFKKYPFKEEGFLTDIRSRVVNRESLNELARKIGLQKLIVYSKGSTRGNANKSMLGDAMEAFIGAIYLDRGYKFCRNFVLNDLFLPNIDFSKRIKEDPNYKSRIIEYAQKKGINIRFEIVEVDEGIYNRKEFTAQIFLDEKPQGIGHGSNKKKAEQSAAKKTLESLNLNVG